MPEGIKQFRDPIYGYIDVDKCALQIIDSPYFQRLRRIKQLAFTCLTYHGAEHTRFEHSLGVYHLAKIIIERLKIEENAGEDFCIAALLHDIGHHPYSHSFESVLENAYEGKENFDHERYTEAIIENTEIKDSINTNGLNPSRIKNFLKGTETNPEFAFLNSLISSELDLDRMDYLLRDSYYCGVPYGRYDFDRLLRAMKPIKGEIVIEDKGRHAAELFILARFYMYVQVYNHHTTRAFDIMLKNTFNKKTIENLEYPRPTPSDINRFLEYDDLWLFNELRNLSKRNNVSTLRKLLAKGILYRDPLRCIVERIAYPPAQTTFQDEYFQMIASINEEPIKRKIAKEAGIKPDYIFSDVPLRNVLLESRFIPYRSSKEPSEETEHAVIKIMSIEGPQDIALDPSSIVSTISKQVPQVIRIYTSKQFRKKVCDAVANQFPKLKSILQYE